MTTPAGISPAAAGVIVALGSVWECIITLFAGRISDKTHSKMGKRKPFIVFLAFPMALTSSLMFAVFNIPVAARVVYYLIITMLYWTAVSDVLHPVCRLGLRSLPRITTREHHSVRTHLWEICSDSAFRQYFRLFCSIFS